MIGNVLQQILFLFLLIIFISFVSSSGWLGSHQAHAQATCSGQFISVSEPLNDLGPNEYIRLDGGPTGFTGGLYPGGTNTRPANHEAAGIAIADQIIPLDASGNADRPHGKIVMISVGMSNTAAEFSEFIFQANGDAEINPQLVIVNGAQSGRSSETWVDPQAETWQKVDETLQAAGVTPQQVQVAWVKLAQRFAGDFPAKAQALQDDLEAIARNLKIRYSNLKIAYYSSRTRAYQYWQGLSPEPVAFETGFAVKWMIEKQLNGDPDLNFDSASGPAVAPYLSWGPYLWIDGLNPRSDGLVWTQSDLREDCTHPSENGSQKVADQLMAFFKSDSTSRPWFLADTSVPPTPGPTVTPTPFRYYLPLLMNMAD